jgi:tellurite resistance protein TehA-like permease
MTRIAARDLERLAGLKLVTKDLSPAYFAMVMATGIVSIAAFMLGMISVAVVLFAANIAAYLALGPLTILRLVWFPRAFLSDLVDHQRAPGFFTFVAGSCVLGSQFILIADNYDVAFALWVLATILWIILIYGIFAALSVKEHKPTLADGINGGWLLAVVSTQAIAVLGTLIAAHWPQPYRLELNFVSLSMWLWGGMLYIWMIALIFYRYTFFDFSPSDLAPPYWINMGAMAISTLEGSLLIVNAPDAPYLHSLLPFLKGFTVFYWATGSWWIPMLLVLGLWRYVIKRFPLRYDPLYWGAVFPVGMYTAATWQMARAMNLSFLQVIPRYFVYFAIFAWTVAFIGLVHTMGRSLLTWAIGQRERRRSKDERRE